MDIEYSNEESSAHQEQYFGNQQVAPQQAQPQFGSLFQNQSRTFHPSSGPAQMTGFFGMQPQTFGQNSGFQQGGFFNNQSASYGQGTGIFDSMPQQYEQADDSRLQAKDFLSDDEDAYNSADEKGEEESGDEEGLAEMVDEDAGKFS